MGEPITLFLAGPATNLDGWNTRLSGESRFRICGQAGDVPGLLSSLGMQRDIQALLLDATMFNGPTQLRAALAGRSAAIHIILPPQALQGDIDVLRQIPGVKGVYRPDTPLSDILTAIQSNVTVSSVSAQSAATMSPAPASAPQPRATQAAMGTRVIAVWNRVDGVGKTTLATNLAAESARRGLPTLLISLGAPDDLPWILNLPDQPNILRYQAVATPDGLKSALQHVSGVEGLDVLAGYPDLLMQADAFQSPLDAPDSIVNLVKSALYGYATVVLDLPANAPTTVLSAANTLVIAARNTLECAVHTAGAIRLIQNTTTWQRLSAIHVVLRVSPNRLSLDEWRRATERALNDSIPAILGQIPDDDLVGAAQDKRKLPLLSVDIFAVAIRVLGNSLLPLAAAPETAPAASPTREKRTLDFGFVKMKV